MNESKRERDVLHKKARAPVGAASYEECGQIIYQKRVSELHSGEDRGLRRKILSVSERGNRAEMKRQVAVIVRRSGMHPVGIKHYDAREQPCEQRRPRRVVDDAGQTDLKVAQSVADPFSSDESNLNRQADRQYPDRNTD